VHWCPAARAVGVVRLDRHIDARQMGWKRTAVGAALGGTGRGDSRVVLLFARLVASDCLLDILERQKHLLGIEPLRTPAELRTSQLPQQVPQPINLRQRTVTLGERGVTLCTRRRNQRMQRFYVGLRLTVMLHTGCM